MFFPCRAVGAFLAPAAPRELDVTPLARQPVPHQWRADRLAFSSPLRRLSPHGGDARAGIGAMAPFAVSRELCDRLPLPGLRPLLVAPAVSFGAMAVASSFAASRRFRSRRVDLVQASPG